MKRSSLKRGTPLKPGKPLQRRAQLSREGWAPPDQRPASVRREARRRSRLDPDHGMDWNDVRNLIYVRSGGRCELCGAEVTIGTMQAHHRRTRQLGPDCACNALALCLACHHGPPVHGYQGRDGDEDPKALGRIVSRHVDDPGRLPVLLHRDRPVFLTCHGTYEPGL